MKRKKKEENVGSLEVYEVKEKNKEEGMKRKGKIEHKGVKVIFLSRNWRKGEENERKSLCVQCNNGYFEGEGVGVDDFAYSRERVRDKATHQNNCKREWTRKSKRECDSKKPPNITSFGSECFLSWCALTAIPIDVSVEHFLFSCEIINTTGRLSFLGGIEGEEKRNE